MSSSVIRPIDVDCHNQLIGHLPTCSWSGGSSHTHTLDLAADSHLVSAKQSHPALVCSRMQKLYNALDWTRGHQVPSSNNWMTTDLLYGGAGITPGFFCCHRAY